MSIVIDTLHTHVIDMEEMTKERGESDSISLRRAKCAVTAMAALTNAVEQALLFLEGEPADHLRAALEDAAGGA